MIFYTIKFIISLSIVLILLGWARTWQMERSPNQARFILGSIPNPLPDSLYNGSVPGHEVSWLGKKFDSSNSTGVNVFKEATTTTEKYPFKTYTGKGLRDKNIDVLKIDYDLPSNPFWLRYILDEIVEVSPSQYLGKLHTRIFGFPFTLGYFELKK